MPVVAGFQGLGPLGRITTLGRGGTDTSAVVLAAALGADRCDIFTDVEGVFTADPRIVATARKLNKITYEEMLELASLGAKVLQIRAVEMAMKHQVPLQVASSFSDTPGTFVVDEDDIVEQERGQRDRLQPRRGEDHGDGRRRPPWRRGEHLRAVGGRQRQCRHDRAEYLRRRHDGSHLHGDGGRSGPPPSRSSKSCGALSPSSGWWPTRAWSRCR